MWQSPLLSGLSGKFVIFWNYSLDQRNNTLPIKTSLSLQNITHWKWIAYISCFLNYILSWQGRNRTGTPGSSSQIFSSYAITSSIQIPSLTTKSSPYKKIGRLIFTTAKRQTVPDVIFQASLWTGWLILALALAKLLFSFSYSLLVLASYRELLYLLWNFLLLS